MFALGFYRRLKKSPHSVSLGVGAGAGTAAEPAAEPVAGGAAGTAVLCRVESVGSN